MSSVQTKCPICQTSLGIRNKKEVKLSCDHKFHYDCAKLRLSSGGKKDCPICHKRSALEEVFGGGKASDKEQPGSARRRSPEHDNQSDHDTSPAKGNSRFSNSYEKDPDGNGWKCSYCKKENSTSSDRCQTCDESKYSPSSSEEKLRNSFFADREMSSVQNKCAICQRSFDIRSRKEVKLSCDHKFHYDCAKLRLKHGTSKDCPLCRKRSALEDAFGGGEMFDKKQSGSARHRSPEHDNQSDHDTSPAKGNSRFSNSYEKDSDGNGWKCSYCKKENSTSSGRIQKCGESKYSPSSDVSESVASAIEKSRDQKPGSHKHADSYDDDRNNFVTCINSQLLK